MRAWSSTPRSRIQPSEAKWSKEPIDIGRCIASSGLLLVKLKHSTSKLSSLSRRQRALLCLLLLSTALICCM